MLFSYHHGTYIHTEAPIGCCGVRRVALRTRGRQLHARSFLQYPGLVEELHHEDRARKVVEYESVVVWVVGSGYRVRISKNNVVGSPTPTRSFRPQRQFRSIAGRGAAASRGHSIAHLSQSCIRPRHSSFDLTHHSSPSCCAVSANGILYHDDDSVCGRRREHRERWCL
jgi:hypothetical protein